MVPLVAVLLPIFIALVAFAVDYGVISIAKLQLQNAADAGAMAAMMAHADDPKMADLAAVETITSNRLFGHEIEFSLEQSVEYGNWDSDSQTFTPIKRIGSVADNSGASIPNGATAVRVRLIRSKERGNGIRLFFAPVLGRTDFANVGAEAIAGFSPPTIGFVGIDAVNGSNNAHTDSYDSTIGNYGGSNRYENGGVRSRGNIHLSSAVNIYGDAEGADVEIQPGSNAKVSGAIIETPMGTVFEDIDFSEAFINDNYTIERGPTWAPPFYNSSTGDLVVNNGRHITLQAGTYHFRNLHLAGGSKLNINGEVKIYVDSELRFDNGTVANLSHQPRNLELNVGDGPVNIQGGHQLHAVIYAPKSDVTIANGSGFFGSIVGKTLTFAGGGGLHFDESLVEQLPSNNRPKLVY